MNVVIEVQEGQVVTGPLWGPQDTHRRLLERKLDIRLSGRGRHITLSGGSPEQLQLGERVVNELLSVVRGGAPLFLHDIEQAVALLQVDGEVTLKELHGRTVIVTPDAVAR